METNKNVLEVESNGNTVLLESLEEEYMLEIELPLFYGFYGDDDLFSNEIDMIIDDVETEFPEIYKRIEAGNFLYKLKDIIDDSIDVKASYKETCRGVVDNNYSYEMEDYFKSCELSYVYSPAEYNFKTDKIIVDVVMTMEQKMAIEKKVFIDERDAFNSHLRAKYSSRDGFMSFTDNNVDDFIESYHKAFLEGDGGEIDKCYDVIVGYIGENEWDAEVGSYDEHSTVVYEEGATIEYYAKEIEAYMDLKVLERILKKENKL